MFSTSLERVGCSNKSSNETVFIPLLARKTANSFRKSTISSIIAGSVNHDSGSMTWNVGAGTHTLDFFYDHGTSMNGGTNE